MSQHGTDTPGMEDPSPGTDSLEGLGISSESAGRLFEEYGIPAITVLLIILGALLVSAWASRVIRGSCTRADLDETLARFFAKMARWIMLLVAAMFCLGVFGIQTASFAVVLGAAGLAVGMALQGTLGNIAAGVMLLVFRPFKVGDAVRVAGEFGKIDEIELFTTAMDTFDNRRIIIPNGTIFGATIENVSHHATRRVDVAVGVDYGADIDKTRQVLEEAAANVEGRLDDPEPAVVLGDLGDSSVNWAVRVWANADDYWPVKQATTRAVKQALDAAGIPIPFPQLDVHLDQAGGSDGAG